MARKLIISQMFDVRPVDEAGNLDWNKIREVENSAGHNRHKSDTRKNNMRDYEAQSVNEGRGFSNWQSKGADNGFKSDDYLSVESSSDYFDKQKENYFEPGINNEGYWEEPGNENEEEYIRETDYQKGWKDFLRAVNPGRVFHVFQSRSWKKPFLAFSAAAASLVAIFGISFFVHHGIKLRQQVLGESTDGYRNLEEAVNNVKSANFSVSSLNFQQAYANFSQAAESIDESGGKLAELLRFAPLASTVSSGKNAAEAGKHLALAGQALNEIAASLNLLKNPVKSQNGNISFLELFSTVKSSLKIADGELSEVNANFEKINIDDIPDDKKEKFLEIKNSLPGIIGLTGGFLDNSGIFVDLLGGNGPRKYLFLFQNNQEMRATGGFIGSYGLLDINEGRIRNFFIDGIFNPDGQLKEKIIPPEPIQKISAAWSLHDSNWWPDFPVSARKAILFYEKTGGPTADGVIAITPQVMEKMLAITGPVEMPDYDTTITADNFIQQTQYEVEVDRDKGDQDPKKILSDLAPLVLDRIFNAQNMDTLLKTVDVLSAGLNEKQILLYSQNRDLQDIISRQNWSGEISQTNRDYLSVINSNINGFKTDGVIDETIEHAAEIQPDGSIIDSVAVSRRHNGGDSQYPWLNQVNVDYMRLYVPEGSKLLEVEGQTREFVEAPLDYAALGFKKDPDVEKEENGITVDYKTGTRIYTDAGKTVFANWTYVSPKEKITVRYKYLLPFKLDLASREKVAAAYSLTAQKQSGSKGSIFISTVKFPPRLSINWKTPDNLQNKDDQARLETDLQSDKFIGLVFTR